MRTIDLTSEGFSLSVDTDGVATLLMTLPGKVNKLSEAFVKGLHEGTQAAFADEGVKGLILASGHKQFCAGGDLDGIFAARDPAVLMQELTQLNAVFRGMETSGKPVVAAITGSALGGGYELALACHHRIALNDPRIQIGLPEVSLGVIPGAGGTQRLPYVIGIQKALEHIAAAKPQRAPKAGKQGLVHALADDVESLMAQAKAWILANPKAKQPWDSGAKFPGGVRPGSAAARQLFVGAAAFLYKRTAGAFAGPEAALQAIERGTKLSFDRAMEVEARLFVKIATSDGAKDMIRTLWYHRVAAEKQEGLPQVASDEFDKVAVLGAGMMGGGLAFVCAKAGYPVVVKDIHQAGLDLGIAHCQAEAKKLRHLDKAAQQAILDRITFTLELEDVRGADLVIEAVVENSKVKHAVIRETEPLLSPDAVFASNTSAIPITLLAEASQAKDRFIGLHFFSPVEKMPLLEIIQPEFTSERTLARCLAFARRIKKTVIVVNDGYGFYTSRFFAAYLLEGCQLVAEGHDPAVVEWAARSAGMVMPPLKVFDEVSLTLGLHAFSTREEVMQERLDSEGIALVKRMVAAGRMGKAAGTGGFYDWTKPRRIWPGLKDLVTADAPEVTGLEHVQRRLMLAQAAELGWVLEESILRNYRDADIGAIFGLGFAPNTGGPLAWMDRQGLPELVAEMQATADTYGERYTPSPYLVNKAAAGERFYPVD